MFSVGPIVSRDHYSRQAGNTHPLTLKTGQCKNQRTQAALIRVEKRMAIN